MAQSQALTLLLVMMLLPVLGAFGLRFLASRIAPVFQYALAALVFGAALGCGVVLARADVATLQIGGLMVLVNDSGQPEGELVLPPTSEPGMDVPALVTPLPPTRKPTITPKPTATLAPTATLPPTEIPPTETPAPPTPTVEPPTPTPALPTAGPGGVRRYTVESGDTLRLIAEKFGVSVQAILDASRLSEEDGDNLRVGQELIIP